MNKNGTLDGYGLDTTDGTFGTLNSFTPQTIPANDRRRGSGGGARASLCMPCFRRAQQIYGWSIGNTGSLTPLSGFPVSAPLTGITEFGYNQQVVITNPAGTLLFISEFANQAILVYQIGSDGTLTAAPGSPFSTATAGLQPQNMAMDGLGKYLYVSEDSANHVGSAIVGYSVSSAGVLSQIPGTWGNSIPIWQMVGDPSGLYMIGITGKTNFLFGSDDQNLYVYNINQSTGALSAAPGSPLATTVRTLQHRHAAKSSGGEFVYSFSINDSGLGDNPIEGFSLERQHRGADGGDGLALQRADRLAVGTV